MVRSKLSNLEIELFDYARKGYSVKGRKIVSQGANIHAVNDLGETPLLCAANNYKWPFVEMALKVGADPNVSASEGWFPIMGACLSNAVGTVEMLIKKGANLYQKDTAGRGLLHLACQQLKPSDDRIPLVKLLLKYPFNLNEQDKWGSTPLFYSLNYNNLNLVQLLIENGAKIDIKNQKGETVFNKTKSQSVIDYLNIAYESQKLNGEIKEAINNLDHGLLF